jgi:hypothetical protein
MHLYETHLPVANPTPSVLTMTTRLLFRIALYGWLSVSKHLLFAAAVTEEAKLAQGDFTAELNGLKLWYKISGNGPVCLMPTPAWGPSSDLWFRTLKPLEKFFTMVYLDSRGTSRSQHAKSTRNYTWDELVADLDALKTHLHQKRVLLMGHSEGGVQVLQVCVQTSGERERFDSYLSIGGE